MSTASILMKITSNQQIPVTTQFKAHVALDAVEIEG
jgi:hypothetical protein